MKFNKNNTNTRRVWKTDEKISKIWPTAKNNNDTDLTAKAPPAKKRIIKQEDDKHKLSAEKNCFEKMVEACY